MRHALVPPFLLALLSAAPVVAQAQTLPDAGRLLQEQAPRLQPPKESPGVQIERPPALITLPGGATVTLQTVTFVGNTVLTGTALQEVIADAIGQSFDIAGLRKLAERVSSHYRANGYPFALAYLPPQSMDDSRLTIAIVEGRYGSITALGNPELSALANEFLAPLKPSAVIESSAMERATLILDDQPGIKVAPLMRPGKEAGTGDLEVYVEREPGFSCSLMADNYGHRYTGEHRLTASAQWDAPFMSGDQVTARFIRSENGMTMGNLGYSVPLGGSGLRASVGYSVMRYTLHLTPTNGNGEARVSSLGLSYPLIRSQQANLSLSLGLQHKDLYDITAVTINRTESDSVPLSLQFDRRDGLAGGGVTYGTLSFTAGRLALDAAQKLADTFATAGRFDHWNLDLARIQALPDNLSLYGRVSLQTAGKNLHSSEGFSIGGPSGVRAYPGGEGNGDEGWLTQVELRYAMGAWSPYLFHDSGRVDVNAKGPNPLTDNGQRSISGAGIGVRYQAGDWSLDAALAGKTHGGVQTADTADRGPHAWVTATTRF
jgi:hemolysin activation/secretion protein